MTRSPQPVICSRPGSLKRLVVASAWIALAALAGGAASAATYLIDVVGPMDLGSVVAATAGDTTFRISPSSGVVTVQSGAGRRISTSSARSQVTITCKPGRGGDLACQNNNVSVRVGAIGSLVGRARALGAFTVAMGTASIVGPPTGASPIAFQLQPPGDNTPRTFFVGADFPVAGDDSGLPTGQGQNGFYVSLVDGNGLTLSSDTDNGLIQGYRALAIAKTADLSFGRIQIPTSGSSTVSLDAATGVRSVSGTAYGYPTPAPTRGAFSITGEGGQQVSLTIPSTFDMTGPSTLTVNVADTAPNAPSLTGSIGSAGSYTFTIGGDFVVSNATPTGAYAGVLTVSLDYN